MVASPEPRSTSGQRAAGGGGGSRAGTKLWGQGMLQTLRCGGVLEDTPLEKRREVYTVACRPALG